MLSLKCKLVFTPLLVLLAAGCPAPAQQGLGRVNGLIIPAVPGAPFSATVVIEAERYWPDGFAETYRTINLIARDSSGRTHNESRRLMPEAFHGSPKLESVNLYDPKSQVSTVYDPETHVAHRSPAPNPVSKPDVSPPPGRIDDLGTSTMNGLAARGTRTTYKLSKKESGMGQPVDVIDEVWHSDDLHLDLLLRHDDPRFGTNTIGVSNLKRGEPPASLFDVPAGYQILNVDGATAGRSMPKRDASAPNP